MANGPPGVIVQKAINECADLLRGVIEKMLAIGGVRFVVAVAVEILGHNEL